MKIFETVFRLLAFLPHVATKQKEIVMSKNKKRITQNQRLIKKFVFWGIFYPCPGFLPHVKGKKIKIFETVFQLPGFLPYERRTE